MGKNKVGPVLADIFDDSGEAEGAFLRLSEQEVLVIRGPWTELSPGGHQVDQDQAHLFYQEFFGGHCHFLKGSSREIVNLSQFLQSELAGISPGDTPQMSDPLAPPRLRKMHFRQTSKELFESDYQVIMGKIQREEIQKAVPIVESFTEHRPRPQQLRQMAVHALRNLPASLRVYGFITKGFGVLGATPETLFSQASGRIRTWAIAGTVPNSGEAAGKELLKDSKQLAEHRLVVEDLQNQLGRWGQALTGATTCLFLPRLIHLQTEVQVETTPRKFEDVLKLLHPTPALGVSPRAYGVRWMSELQNQKRRGLFGGPLGFVTGLSNPTAGRLPQAEVLVAIRNLYWDQNGSWVRAGAGLVRHSQLEHEWAELLAKVDSVFASLGID